MPTVRITTSKTRNEIKSALAKLPQILQGESNTLLFRKFTSRLIYEIYKLIDRDNRLRSAGSSGVFTPKWKPLSLKTIKNKIYLKKKFANLNPKSILIRSHRLLTAFKPGTLTDANYKPINFDQHVTINYKQIILECKIPYYDTVTKIRPILPEKLDKLIAQAITNIIPEILPYLL